MIIITIVIIIIIIIIIIVMIIIIVVKDNHDIQMFIVQKVSFWNTKSSQKDKTLNS